MIPPSSERALIPFFHEVLERKEALCVVIVGLALLIIGICCAAISGYAHYIASRDIDTKISNSLLATDFTAATLIIFGVIIIAETSRRTIKARKEQKSTGEVAKEATKITSSDVRAMQIKLSGLAIAILATMVGLGIIIGSKLVLNNCSDLQTTVQNAIADPSQHQHLDYWNALQSWIDATSPHMHTLMIAGICTLVGSVAIAAIAILQAQIRKCRQQTEKTVIE